MDNKKLDSEDTIDFIPNDAIISIPVSGAFYAKLKETLYMLLSEQMDNPAQLPIMLKELEARGPTDILEQHLTIYLALIYQIEKSAKENKLVVNGPIAKFTPDPAPEASPEN